MLELISVADNGSLTFAPCEHARSITESPVEGTLRAHNQVAADTICLAAAEDEDEAAENR